MRSLLILLALPLLALDNSVTIYDAASVGHISRPILIHRWFAEGEIANYAKPRIGGVTPAAWQCDVAARWDDGSVRLAYVSWRQNISAGGSVTADFVNDTNRSSAGDSAATDAAALSQSGMELFDPGGGPGAWNGIIEGTLNSIAYTANAKTMLAAGNWRYYLRGPVVTWVILEDRSTSLSHDFGWQYSGGAWIAPSLAKYRSLHPIIMAQFWPGAGVSSWPGVEIDAILWTGATTRLQRIPLDKLRVLTGISGTTESYCAGTGCSITSAGTPNLFPRRTWHTVRWSGTEPSKIVVDFNFPYLIYSKALLPYDTSLLYPQSMTDSIISNYASNLGTTAPEWCNPSSGACANWAKYVPGTGGRGDIAPIPQWYTYYLYAMGSGSWTTARKLDLWEKALLGNADAGSSYPIHYWESDPTRSEWFGRIVSSDTRPTVGLRDREMSTQDNVSTSDTFDPVCSTSPCSGVWASGDATYSQGWTPDSAHQPSFFFLPALLTGRPFYIWEQMFLANYMTMGENAFRGNWDSTSLGGASCFSPWYGKGTPISAFGVNSGQLRGGSWAVREIWLGAAISPDGSQERDYFSAKLRNTDALLEGYYNITDGLYPPADSACPGFNWRTSIDPWCHGRNFRLAAGESDLRIGHFGNHVNTSQVGNHSAIPCSGASIWQFQMYLTSLAWANQAGVVKTGGRPVFARSRAEGALWITRNVMESFPSSVAMYVFPTAMLKSGVGRAPANRSEMDAMWDRTGTLAASINSTDTSFQFGGALSHLPAIALGWMYAQPIGVIWVENEAIVICKEVGEPHPGPATATACPGGRGALGTTAVSHSAGAAVRYEHLLVDNDYTGGYTNFARAGLAVSADTQVGSYASARAAYERIAGGHVQPNPPTEATHGTPTWQFVPRKDPLNVRVFAGTGSITLRYNAPDLGACSYRVGVMPNSSDTGDTSDGGGPVARTVTVSGLPAGSTPYRITCGAGRVLGAATVQ